MTIVSRGGLERLGTAQYGLTPISTGLYKVVEHRLGRDLLSRIIWGTQISLFVGVSTVALTLIIGVAPGVVAGYYGDWADMIIMRYIDLQ